MCVHALLSCLCQVKQPHGVCGTDAAAHSLKNIYVTGLPPDDEAVQLASAAAAAGASLRQLVEFSHAAGAARAGYAASAVQDPRTGRITAGSGAGGEESLYGDMARWLRPEDMEAWLAARKVRPLNNILFGGGSVCTVDWDFICSLLPVFSQQ